MESLISLLRIESLVSWIDSTDESSLSESAELESSGFIQTFELGPGGVPL